MKLHFALGGALALVLSAGTANASPMVSIWGSTAAPQHASLEVQKIHHKPGHHGGRGLHLGWYKKNKGKHKGWKKARWR
ncbi:MAG TPA: hypothetical protein VFV47_02750 [Hyphomicrobiaceae bacterium]|nr:hypothetical protein [Hyphomicrobiaceae bacterium]